MKTAQVGKYGDKSKSSFGDKPVRMPLRRRFMLFATSTKRLSLVGPTFSDNNIHCNEPSSARLLLAFLHALSLVLPFSKSKSPASFSESVAMFAASASCTFLAARQLCKASRYANVLRLTSSNGKSEAGTSKTKAFTFGEAPGLRNPKMCPTSSSASPDSVNWRTGLRAPRRGCKPMRNATLCGTCNSKKSIMLAREDGKCKSWKIT
mmetsp:Transcript_34984/g.105648  ORF Transcript_34984/g.105648 Transcript_34984/m.105648 type:complete len:207 (-) Transcript_34984:622-1242(-)